MSLSLLPRKRLALPRRGLISGAAAVVAMASVPAQAQCALFAPPQAAAAGFTHLVFNDDFVTTTTVSPTSGGTGSPAYNWYWQGINSTSQYSINTNYVPGVTDSKPVAAGRSSGVLTILTQTNTFSAGLQSIFPSQLSSNTTGAFNRGYFECYMLANYTAGPGGTAVGWPAAWLWDLATQNAATNGQVTAEADIVEYYPNGGANAAATAISTLHNWEVVSGSRVDEFNTNGHNVLANQPSDSGWHKFGMLWTGSGSGSSATGTVSFYVDDVLQVMSGTSSFSLIANTNAATAGLTAMAADFMFWYLGTAENTIGPWTASWDYLRVWQ